MLKIKENIELEKLKNLGFIESEDGKDLMYETSYETIIICKLNRIISIIAGNTLYEAKDSLEILMDLILYGFVEKL